MVVKGEIQTINLLENTCTVRLPFFESSAGDAVIATATFSNTPGSYNGYLEGDIVWVAFEDGQMQWPVIIGKLFLGTQEEEASPRGAINCVDLKVSGSAKLPVSTALDFKGNENTAEDASGNTGYKTIADLIAGIKQASTIGVNIPHVAICQSADTNLYGYKPEEFSFTPDTVNGAYYQILYNGSADISAEHCLEYMYYMTGMRDIPKEAHYSAFTEAIMFTNGIICYPEYIGTSLKLIKTSASVGGVTRQSGAFMTEADVDNYIENYGTTTILDTRTGQEINLAGAEITSTADGTTDSTLQIEIINTVN